MKTDTEILKEWAKTYGDNEHDIKASLYGKDLMLDFAKYYHQHFKNNDSLDNVSLPLLLDDVKERLEISRNLMESIQNPLQKAKQVGKFHAYKVILDSTSNGIYNS